MATLYVENVPDDLYKALRQQARYAALAVSIDAQFVTADEKLANALAAHLPVKFLGTV